ncbi:polyketide cyclase/dehydrase/lipid transport protein [Herbihabitans rhizosphaerae]|uniref:Polyketide cyclase/dehydrase/lipid transport protein n=1 Tax=Herbihabitans rhizosphaerae TaxID=1872711 RepID=A0A4Q7KYQ3_9PSEU|nr:SRPBCC family protein [Herbihabitans rhizosphaerae]RZS41191.1 polyketide cyclase/dehydrase/lipid transport protein [Herbihabitans rhizosphaerae]
MAPVQNGTDIARTPQDVFDYVADASHLPQWQDDVEKVEIETPDIVGKGMVGVETRRIQGSSRSFRWEVTEYEPGKRWRCHVIEGPLRTDVMFTFTPIERGTHVDVAIDFKSKGIGKLIAPFARRSTNKDLPGNLAHLKSNLESVTP